MKNASVCAKKFSALLKKIGTADAPKFPDWHAPVAAGGSSSRAAAAAGKPEPISVVIASMLLWEATTDKALAAYSRLQNELVDFNDLRVCMPHETVEHIGQRFPLVQERCQRLRAVLRTIYLREHAMNLDRLHGAGKREVKKYIESLEGIVPYAASRVQLLCFDAHVIPVDEQLRDQLVAQEIADASMETAELGNWLAMHVKIGEGPNAHFGLQSWMDGIAERHGGEKKSAARKPAARAKSSGKRGNARAAAG